ncbi:MAG: YqaA family protein [Planctomycetota bacterium]|jgi:membrane protein YqaA with SNARE-associated domain
MYDWVLSWAESPYGWLALVVLSFAESSFFPIPPDVLLIALCLGAPKLAFLFALACSCASVVGGLFGYLLGFALFNPVVKPVMRFLRLEKHFDAALEYYNRYDVWAVGIAGFTPIPYKVFTVAAGMARLNVFKFVIVSALSRSARFFLVATLLFFFGEAANRFINKHFDWLALVFCVLLVGSFVLVGWYFGKKKKKEEPESSAAAASSEEGESESQPQP